MVPSSVTDGVGEPSGATFMGWDAKAAVAAAAADCTSAISMAAAGAALGAGLYCYASDGSCPREITLPARHLPVQPPMGWLPCALLAIESGLS